MTDCALTETDVTHAEEMVAALKPMFVATNIMCEEKCPTISIIAPLHAQLLRDTISAAEDPAIVQDIKGAIHQDLSKRYQSAEEKDLLHVSSALDPRVKSLLFSSPQQQQDTYSKLVTKAAALNDGPDVLFDHSKQENAKELPHTEEPNNKKKESLL